MPNLPGGTRYYTISGVLLAKTCRKCRKTRDIEKFKQVEAAFDGHTTMCSKCLYADELKQAQDKEAPKKLTEDPAAYHRMQVEKYRSRTDTELSRVIKDKYPDGTKKCVKCNNTYDLSKFYRNKSYPTGISYRCRKCHKA